MTHFSAKCASAAFIDIITDRKTIGLGEIYAGYFCPETGPVIVDFFNPILVRLTVENMDKIAMTTAMIEPFTDLVAEGLNVRCH